MAHAGTVCLTHPTTLSTGSTLNSEAPVLTSAMHQGTHAATQHCHAKIRKSNQALLPTGSTPSRTLAMWTVMKCPSVSASCWTPAPGPPGAPWHPTPKLISVRLTPEPGESQIHIASGTESFRRPIFINIFNYYH